MAPRSGSLPLTDQPPMGARPQLSLINGSQAQPADTGVSFEDGAMKIAHPDGSVTVDFNPKKHDADDADDKGFSGNLAKKMDEGDLGSIATDLLEGIQRDDDSRREWLDTRALGITLLGTKLEKPRSDTGLSGAPLEGMSTVRHPLLLDATVSFQATARGNLLPASGPVKVRNDSPPPPVAPPAALQSADDKAPPMTPAPGPSNAAQDIADSLAGKDILSQALEKDMNHYLTSIATEYVPDTDRMLFLIGLGGDGFKKVFNCPIRRRPVSESVDAEDLIISNHCTDMQNSGRVTHRIFMRKSVLRRMQILGVYLDIEIPQPSVPLKNAVDMKKEEVEGINPSYTRPQDQDHEIYECYCELDLDEFAPKQFKGKGVPLPYRVTIEKESKKILDLRRNWREDDEQCIAKQFFVQFPFIRGLGFYGLGFIHLLGNLTNALTAAYREMLDAGMFNCFPGFLYAKGVGRQNTNQFRVPPGGGVGIDVGAQQRLQDAVMPLPYKEPGPSFTAFIQHMEEGGRKLAATGDISVGEGKQDAPVGTTLALIEQASKVIDSAHKRLHASQAEEFKLLKERFQDDPEAFWRHNKKPTIQWEKDQFIEALEHNDLVPVADPNNPTSLHRIAKAMAIKQLQQGNPALYDAQAVDMRIMRIVDIDPTGLFAAQPAAPPPDPRMAAVQAKAQAEQGKMQILQLQTQIKAAELQASTQDKAQERASRERIEQMKLQLENMRIQQEQIIHAHDLQRDSAESVHKMQLDHAAHQQELQHDAISSLHEVHGGRIKTAQEIAMDHERHRADMDRTAEEHKMKMEHAREEHQTKLQHAHDLNMAKVEAARQLAKVKKPATKK
jgi:hypothetical protein